MSEFLCAFTGLPRWQGVLLPAGCRRLVSLADILGDSSPEMIRDATPADFETILALNLESEHFLSPMSREVLEILHGAATYHRVVFLDGKVEAFLLAFREGTLYDGQHYLWFAERYPSFLYVDRVVVGGMAQGQGLGSVLYDDLFAYARRIGVPRVTCEIDVEPPNEASHRFHAKYGFREVGRQPAGSGTKVVSMQEAPLRP
ncbi:MAG TPA: GNAT family N-acetyltransferase [Thermoanaerobaculia bacterium]|nr:GNAT family N-acetyltransferase [Thermoanaerobaculia bacterium]